MKELIMLFLLISCTRVTPQKSQEDLVSVGAALNQAQASYLRGCVEAMKELKIPIAFPGCRDKAILHRQEIESILETEP